MSLAELAEREAGREHVEREAERNGDSVNGTLHSSL